MQQYEQNGPAEPIPPSRQHTQSEPFPPWGQKEQCKAHSPNKQNRPYEKNESPEQYLTMKDSITILSEIPKNSEASEAYEEMVREVKGILLSILPDTLHSRDQPDHSSAEKQ